MHAYLHRKEGDQVNAAYWYLTGILYLAPASESRVMNTCAMASEGCKKACLFTAGRAAFIPAIIEARIRKTQWLFADRAGFIAQLRKDVAALVRKAAKLGLKPAVRVNGTSDLPWIPMQLSAEFPTVQWYDYSKLPKPWLRTRGNYHITFSLSETNKAEALDALSHGVNVAVVFNTKKGQPLPPTWEGFEIINGDAHDLRFLDARPDRAVVIGLYAKGQAKKDRSGFVHASSRRRCSDCLQRELRTLRSACRCRHPSKRFARSTTSSTRSVDHSPKRSAVGIAEPDRTNAGGAGLASYEYCPGPLTDPGGHQLNPALANND